MQSCEMPRHAFADLMADEKRRRALGTVHHKHLADGKVRVSQVVSGTRDADIHARLDRSQAILAEQGATGFYRTKIGRNTSCPCGSGRKFKKCCLPGAIPV